MGIQGTIGQKGKKGLKGNVGDTGAPGQAIQGPRGLQGAMGPVGMKGEKGSQGLTGKQGPVGPIGRTGMPGPRGTVGNPGINGLRGSPGPKGAKGATPTSEIEQLRKELSELKEHVIYSRCQCSCLLKLNPSLASGVYSIIGPQNKFIQVYCDMDTDGGGWTVFQRRQDGSVDFYRGWNDYKNGFGNINGEFWLGLDYIHWLLSLSKSGNELRVDLEDRQGNKAYAKYSTFSVGDESTKYVLGVSGYSGDAKDRLDYHNGMKFSTKDQDNDLYHSESCAVTRHGAWWYDHCAHSNLNGDYHKKTIIDGIRWVLFPLLKFSEMKFRSV